MTGLIDTHAHLDEMEDLAAAVGKAGLAGVAGIIAVGQDLNSNTRNLEMSASYPGYVYPALGLHPWAISRLDEAQLEQNIGFISDNLHRAIALGEVGLDYDKRVLKTAGRDIQKEVLRRLLALALRHDKPVSLHSRYAWKDALQEVINAGITKLVFHWYTGFSSTLTELIEAGYYISATPAAEYHDEHRRAIREVPLDRLLLETDCPVYYGREQRYRSQPSDVVRSLQATAAIKGIPEEEAATFTTANACRLFGLPVNP
ncbi:MAG: TatD family hydrolase [Dehalococcoidia bacterium]|nr:TatD family hydrolase [Dehalococcoidia bacterium]